MLTFDTPGSFILTPEMYRYANSFIIEMWGAGGAGGTLYGYCYNNNYGYAGCPGQYYSTTVYTNQSIFYVTIGQGGYNNMSSVCSSNICSLSYSELSINGGYTSLSGQNISIAVSGGNNGGCASSNHECDNLNGSNAVYGGPGGIYKDPENINGSFPGGGASSMYFTWIWEDSCSLITIPSGGNGGIILYLSPKYYADDISLQVQKIIIEQNTVLTPEMYGHSDNFIVKMWGGGSSSGYNCCPNINTGKGAGSGAYINANIRTNNATFSVTIGRGGGPTIPFTQSCYTQCTYIETDAHNFYGDSSSLISTSVNLTVGGGTMTNGGHVVSAFSNNTNDLIYVTKNGNIKNCAYGGDSWYGVGEGAGANFYMNNCNQGSCFTITIPRGSSGSVILYYTPKSRSTNSLSYTVTFTSTNTYSCSMTPTTSIYQTTTQSISTTKSNYQITTPTDSKYQTVSEPVSSDSSIIYISNSNSSILKKMFDILIIVSVLVSISAILILSILIIYCVKTSNNNFKVDINCNQKIILDDL